MSRAADEDGDGKLTLAEFFAFTHPEETSRMFDAVVEIVLGERDADKDGKLSFEVGSVPVFTLSTLKLLHPCFCEKFLSIKIYCEKTRRIIFAQKCYKF